MSAEAAATFVLCDGAVEVHRRVEGEGARVGRGFKVFVHYTGTYQVRDEQGTATASGDFGSSHGRGVLSFVAGSDQTIPGLDQAVQKLREGDECTILVKAQQAFGPMGNPHGFHGSGKAIPPNADLTFELTLCAAKGKEEQAAEAGTAPSYAEERKTAGNASFRAGKLLSAITHYQLANEHVDEARKASTDPSPDLEVLKNNCLANLALCWLKLEKPKLALTCCNEVLERDASNIKALFRKAKALAMSKDFEEAERLLVRVVELGHNTKDVQRELTVVRKGAARAQSEQNRFLSGMFNRLEKDSEALYSEDDLKRAQEEERKAREKKCPYCDETVEEIQYARHLIKYHSGEKKDD
eukprot:TRINITY_DN2659_c0_g2_i1.p1 TRINITY_DN2659_c0_g2~~TRINITY_DN2659_c0_g2_i1.p1  ORF type:complete len:355 (-),score=98.55 TRINITY_DN2659_c0_g2_i1:603-1667(-)